MYQKQKTDYTSNFTRTPYTYEMTKLFYCLYVLNQLWVIFNMINIIIRVMHNSFSPIIWE
jgi:hypothetical protein